MKHCRNCKFYNLEDETVAGEDDEILNPVDFESECKRYPPVRGDAEYYGDMNGGLLRDCFSGPIVQAINWCGEWHGRER